MAAEVIPNANVRSYHKIDGLTTIYVNLGNPLCVSLLFETAAKAEKFAKIIIDAQLPLYKGWLNLADPNYVDDNPCIRNYAAIPAKELQNGFPYTTIRGLIHGLGYAVVATEAFVAAHDVTLVPVDLPPDPI